MGKFSNQIIIINNFLLKDALYKIVKYEGLKTLWRGLPPSILITVPASVLYFTSYETAKETLEKTKMFGFFTIPIIAG